MSKVLMLMSRPSGGSGLWSKGYQQIDELAFLTIPLHSYLSYLFIAHPPCDLQSEIPTSDPSLHLSSAWFRTPTS